MVSNLEADKSEKGVTESNRRTETFQCFLSCKSFQYFVVEQKEIEQKTMDNNGQ